MLAALMMALPAAAQSDINLRYKGKEAHAFFSSVKGGVVTEVSVSAHDTDKRRGGPAGSGAPSEAFVEVIKYDAACAEGPFPEPPAVDSEAGPGGCERPLMQAAGFAPLAPNEFVIDRKLGSARLNTQIELQNFDCGAEVCAQVMRTLDVDLTWTAAGERKRINERYSYSTPGFSYKGRVKGFSRAAVASGSVSEGSTNFAIGRSEFAQMSAISSRFKQKGQQPEGEGFPGIGGGAGASAEAGAL